MKINNNHLELGNALLPYANFLFIQVPYCWKSKLSNTRIVGSDKSTSTDSMTTIWLLLTFLYRSWQSTSIFMKAVAIVSLMSVHVHVIISPHHGWQLWQPGPTRQVSIQFQQFDHRWKDQSLLYRSSITSISKSNQSYFYGMHRILKSGLTSQPHCRCMYCNSTWSIQHPLENPWSAHLTSYFGRQ